MTTCDPSTLAIFGRVSFDVLVATAPQLYRSVEIKSVEKLKQLFCERKQTENDSESARINPSLSLDFASGTEIFHYSLNLPLSRASSTRIPLRSVNFVLQHDVNHFYLYKALHPSVDPLRVSYDLRGRPYDGSIWNWMGGRIRFRQPNRLEQAEFRGGIMLDFGSKRIGHFPPPHPDRRRILRFHIPSLLDDYFHPDAFTFMNCFVVNDPYIWLDRMQEGSIVLIVDSQEQKKQVEDGIQALKVQRWRSRFSIELEL